MGTDHPIYEQVATDLADDPLADCPDPGPLRPEDEPRLFDAVTLPTLAAPLNESDEGPCRCSGWPPAPSCPQHGVPDWPPPDDEPEACRGCGDTPHHLSTDGHCDGCVADGQDREAAS
jgi:hypothetical protein